MNSINLFYYFLDLLFPPSKEELYLQNLKDDDLYIKYALTNTDIKNMVFAVFDYSHQDIRKLIHGIKFKNRINYIEKLTPALYDLIIEKVYDLENFENFKNPIITCVPLSNKRKRERGFNQGERIIKSLQEKGLNFETKISLIKKIKNTKAQSSLKNRLDRFKNVKNYFSCTEDISGRNIILVDDVITTCATVNEVKKVLKKSGARKVVVFALAH